jgi:hypothetical protein
MTPGEALRRNERYVREFVEALQLCPFAKRCREEGKLFRRVVEEASAPVAMRMLDLLPEEAVEVALLIVPAFDRGARAFEELVASLRPNVRNYYCVAFHPDLPRDLADEHRSVPFIRRTPDPTMQMVRSSVLSRVRGNSDGERFVDISRLSTAEILALQSPISLSDRIAQQNLETLRWLGPDSVEALLESMR